GGLSANTSFLPFLISKVSSKGLFVKPNVPKLELLEKSNRVKLFPLHISWLRLTLLETSNSIKLLLEQYRSVRLVLLEMSNPVKLLLEQYRCVRLVNASIPVKS